MRRASVFRIPMAGPDDMSGLIGLLDSATVQARDIVAILAKTEGNGCVNDYVRDRLRDEDILHDWSLYSSVASASAGVELLNNEVIVMGNSADVGGDLLVGHSVMRDAIDAEAVREALRTVGLSVQGGLDPTDLDRVVNVLAKAEPDPFGSVRGRRSTMLDDSDINSTRHARAVVNAVIASVVGDPMLYVSGGAEHQGPAGGGPVAVIARVRASRS
ncbi:MAG TPA: ring-opening amidohydrolase [Chloroflexota bacterium]|jgi:cyanuric acid amidohydrolase|nr:ring-opening amidohydrolase [Chloroflexota bacterium]